MISKSIFSAFLTTINFSALNEKVYSKKNRFIKLLVRLGLYRKSTLEEHFKLEVLAGIISDFNINSEGINKLISIYNRKSDSSFFVTSIIWFFSIMSSIVIFSFSPYSSILSEIIQDSKFSEAHYLVVASAFTITLVILAFALLLIWFNYLYKSNYRMFVKYLEELSFKQ